jgi:hypothetical protein
MENTPGLTIGHTPDVARQIALSYSGMAHFAATGPLGATCGECVFYGYYRKILNKAGNTIRTRFRGNACQKFYEFTKRHGPDFPDNAEACRYFMQRSDDDSVTTQAGVLTEGKLKWDDGWQGSYARAPSRKVGGNYEIIERGNGAYQVQYRYHGSNSLDEAKAIAEADYTVRRTKRA